MPRQRLRDAHGDLTWPTPDERSIEWALSDKRAKARRLWGLAMAARADARECRCDAAVINAAASRRADTEPTRREEYEYELDEYTAAGMHGAIDRDWGSGAWNRE